MNRALQKIQKERVFGSIRSGKAANIILHQIFSKLYFIIIVEPKTSKAGRENKCRA